MNAVIRRLALFGVGLQFFLASAAALAGPFTSAIDEFWITKGGAGIFRDSFADGKLPAEWARRWQTEPEYLHCHGRWGVYQ